jgi:hypothetical protein
MRSSTHSLAHFLRICVKGELYLAVRIPDHVYAYCKEPVLHQAREPLFSFRCDQIASGAPIESPHGICLATQHFRKVAFCLMPRKGPDLHFPDALASAPDAAMHGLSGFGIIAACCVSAPCLGFQFGNVFQSHDMFKTYNHRRLGQGTVWKKQLYAPLPVKAGLLQLILHFSVVYHSYLRNADFRRMAAVGHEVRHIAAPRMGEPAQMRFQQLSDIHARDDAMRIQDDVYWTIPECFRQTLVIWQMRH